MRKPVPQTFMLTLLLLGVLAAASPQNTSQQNKTNLSFANAMLPAANISNATQAPPAIPCNSTADCASGYCFNSKCTAPEPANFVKGPPCNSTGDCFEGFCQRGDCLIPLPATAVFEFGAKPACSPVIECSPGTTCAFGCDFLWILLLVFALGAGYISRKERNRIVPIVLFLLPIVLGLYIYPIIGIMVGAVEMLIFFSKKPKPEEKEEEKPPAAPPALGAQAPLQPIQPDLPQEPSL